MKRLYPIHLFLIASLAATPAAQASLGGMLLGLSSFSAFFGSTAGLALYFKKKKDHRYDPKNHPIPPSLAKHLLGGAAIGAGSALTGGIASWALVKISFDSIQNGNRRQWVWGVPNDEEPFPRWNWNNNWNVPGAFTQQELWNYTDQQGRERSVYMPIATQLNPECHIIPSEDNECVICSENNDDTTLVCGHKFCKNCTANCVANPPGWNGPHCPMCRAPVAVYRP